MAKRRKPVDPVTAAINAGIQAGNKAVADSKRRPARKPDAKLSPFITSALPGIKAPPVKQAPKPVKKSATVTNALAGITGDKKAPPARRPARKPAPKKAPPKRDAKLSPFLTSAIPTLRTPTAADRASVRKDREHLRRLIASGKLGGDNIPYKAEASIASQLLKFAVKKPGKLPGSGGRAPLGTVAALPAPNDGVVYKGAALALLNTARATAEDPVGVSKATVNSVPLIARGMAGAGVELVTHPKRFIASLPKTVRDDYVRRYGDVLDNPKAFRERLKKDGILPEILDVSTVGIPTVSVAGRVATKVAESGAAGAKAERFVKAPRPDLRVGAGPREVRPQDKSPNAARLAAQRAKDTSRAKAVAKRKADAKPFRGLEPGPGEVVKKSVRAQNRDQRKIVARTSARTQARVVRDLDREVTGKTGVVGNVRKLTREEAAALPLVIRMGLPADSARAVAALRKYKALVVKERARTGREPTAVDNLTTVDAIIANPGKYLTPRVRQAADVEVARGKRVAKVNPSVSKDSALRRQYDDQAALLGLERKGTPTKQALKDAKAAKAAAATKRYAGNRTPAEVLAYIREAEKAANDLAAAKKAKKQGQALVNGEPAVAFTARVQAAAAREGLAEPGYVFSREFSRGGAGAYTGGNVGKAVQGDKQNRGVLFKTGMADSSIETMKLGMARGVKRSHNWHGVADTIARNAPDWGRGKTGTGMPVAALEREIIKRGLDPKDWAFIDTGKFRRTLDDVELAAVRDGKSTESATVASALQGATMDLAGAKGAYKSTGQRLTAVPRAVADELTELTRPGGSVVRGFQKFQGVQSKILLGTNPTFVPIQVLSNTPLAMLALRGNVKALLDGQLWYRRLDPAARDVLDEYLGLSASQSFGASPRFGEAADSRLTRFYEAVATNDRVLSFREGKRNPLNWNMLLDGKQNDFFRRAVFYDAARRSARQRMSNAGVGILKDAEPLMDALKLPPGPAREAALRRAEPEAERIADKVNSILGDYTTFTAKERKYLKSSVMFYGFLRWATQLAFYTLPIKHPVATSIAGKLGQLHNEEVISLLSDEAAALGMGSKKEVAALLRKGAMPYVFGRVWFTKKGKLEYVDATRLNPLLGPLMETAESIAKKGLVAGTFKGVLGLPSPAISAGLDAAYGKSSFTGQDLKDQDGNPLGPSERFFGGQMLNMAYPIRVADQVLNPGTKSDDSLPLIDPRLKPATGDAAAAREEQKRSERGTDMNVLLDNLLPIARSKQDGTMRGIARLTEMERKRKGADKPSSGGTGYGGSAPSGGSSTGYGG